MAGSVLDGPSKAVGIAADVEMACDREGLEVKENDVVVGRAGDKGASPVGLHEDAGRTMADGHARDDLARGSVENNEIGRAEQRDENAFAVRRELESIGAAGVGLDGGNDLHLREVDDGDGAIAGVGDPGLFAVGRYVEAFVARADRNDRFIPIAARGPRHPAHGRLALRRSGHARWWAGRHSRRRARRYAGCAFGLVENRDRTCVDVGGEDAFGSGKDVDHVRAILADADDAIDCAGRRIVAANGFCCFGSEPEFAIDEVEAVGSAQRAEIDGRERLLRKEIDDGDGVIGAKAVIGDIGGFAVGGGDDFVRIFADGDARNDVQACGIDDRKGVIGLGQRQKRDPGGSLLSRGAGNESRSKPDADEVLVRSHGYPASNSTEIRRIDPCRQGNA